MVKQIVKYCVIQEVEMDNGLYPLIPPIECTIAFNEHGWSAESIDIKVENCKSLAQAVQNYEILLQECIIAGQIHINMNESGDMN